VKEISHDDDPTIVRDAKNIFASGRTLLKIIICIHCYETHSCFSKHYIKKWQQRKKLRK